MILVYVCPECNAVRIASRRNKVECLECDAEMLLSDLSFLEWSEMTPSQRTAYGSIWYKKETERKRKWQEKQKIMEDNKKNRKK